MDLFEPRRFARLLAPAVLLFSAGVLGTVFVAQYGFDLQPCVLCLYQRIPFFVAAGLAVWTLILPGASPLALARLFGLIFIASAALAFYHVGVEQHWWAAATGCAGGGANFDALQSAVDLKAALFAEKPVACDAVAWSLFGLSFAAYNALASLAAGIVCFLGARRIAGESAP
ncbi:MAG: disulfide bond formation protein B [Proteobacteria bacterium]|nr:disulfide bond formation protein B [Pseudomonadota bacterium]